jgi:hypothetical protein
MTPNGDDTTVPSVTLTILERAADGSAHAYSYRPPLPITDLLMAMLGDPTRVMYIPAEEMVRISETAWKATDVPGIEVWQAGDDHMPEAMWPDDEPYRFSEPIDFAPEPGPTDWDRHHGTTIIRGHTPANPRVTCRYCQRDWL